MSKMTMPMSNLNQGGYVPHGFMPNAPAAPGNGLHAGNYGFVNRQQQQGYAPVPQIPYGDTSFAGAAFPPYAGQPAYGGAHAQQMPYGGSPAQQHSAAFQPGYGRSADPIVTQPIAPGQGTGPQGDWMNIPVGIPNCPRGLEYLTSIDQLLVKQKVELLEAITGFETNNKFTIKNALGQKVYYAVEENDCCTRNMCGPARPFDMKIFDNFRNEVIHLHRPLACSSCLFPCCLQSMEVSAPPGNVIGSIEQEWTVLSPSFKIKNHIGDTVLRIQGPLCTYSLCGEVEFNIVSLTGECIGKISKQWSGLAREIFTDADFFGITFPLDLDVRIKVVLLGATFLIDAMFFEKALNVERDGPGML